MHQKKKVIMAVCIALIPLAAQAQGLAPAALPGSFSTNVSGVTYTSTGSNSATITVPGSPTILAWGSNPVLSSGSVMVEAPAGITTVPGFDIGQDAKLTVTSPFNNVIIADESGNLSEIAGQLTINADSPPIIANSNGITLDQGAVINAPRGIILSGQLPDLTNSGPFLSDHGTETGIIQPTGSSGNITIDGTIQSSAQDQSIGIYANNLQVNSPLGGPNFGEIDVHAAGNIQGGGGFSLADSGQLLLSFGGMINNNGAAAAAAAAAGAPGAWQYNDVPVLVANGGSVNIALNPTNSSTHQQFVNLMVEGNATLNDPTALENDPSGFAKTGQVAAFSPAANPVPSSHLVIQSTGNITLGASGGYYWPGLVYAAAVSASNNLLTVGSGIVDLAGNLSTVVPTLLPNGGGVYFESDQIDLNGYGVAVNSNSFVNVLPTSNLARSFASTSTSALPTNFFAVAGTGGNQLSLTSLPPSDVVGRGMDGSLSTLTPMFTSTSTSQSGLPSNANGGSSVVPPQMQQISATIQSVEAEPQVQAAAAAMNAALDAYLQNENSQTYAAFESAATNYGDVMQAAVSAAGI